MENKAESDRWIYRIHDMSKITTGDSYIRPSRFNENYLATTYVWAEPETIARHIVPPDHTTMSIWNHVQHVDGMRHHGTEVKDRKPDPVSEGLRTPILDAAIDYGLGCSIVQVMVNKNSNYFPGLVAINFDDLEAELDKQAKTTRFVEDPEVRGYRGYMMFDQDYKGIDIPLKVCKVVPLTLMKRELKSKMENADKRAPIADAYLNYTRKKVDSAIAEYESSKRPFARIADKLKGRKVSPFAKVVPSEVAAVA